MSFDSTAGRATFDKKLGRPQQAKSVLESGDTSDADTREKPHSRFHRSEESVRLATRLQSSATAGQLIVFTGTDEKDGIATVVTQVALAMVQAGVQPVLLIDANVHAPAIHNAFDISIEPGLAQLLEGTVTAEMAIKHVAIADLWVLPAGIRSDDSVGLFSSAAFSAFFSEIKKQFRFVIVNSPPILDHAESLVIAGRSDGVVMVVASGRRTRTDLRRIKEELDGVKAHLLGAVLSQS